MPLETRYYSKQYKTFEGLVFFFFELLVFLVVFSEYFSELVMSTKPCETSDIKEGICLTLCLLCLC